MVPVWGWAEKQPSFITRCRKSHRCWKHSAVPQQFSGFLPHGQQCFKGCTQAVTSSITAVPRRVSCCSQLRAGRSPHRLLPSSPAPQWQKLLLFPSSKSFAQPMAVASYFDPRDGLAPCGASKAVLCSLQPLLSLLRLSSCRLCCSRLGSDGLDEFSQVLGRADEVFGVRALEEDTAPTLLI